MNLTSLDGLSAHFASSWRMGVFFFISNNVVRREEVYKYLKDMYHWAYSTVPQAVFVLGALRDGKIIRIFPQSVAFYKKAEEGHMWNQWRYLMGVATLSEIEGCEKLFTNLFPKFFAQRIQRPLISLPAIAIRGGTRGAEFWKAYYLRMAGCTTGLLSAYFALCAFILAPILKVELVQSVIRKVFGYRNDIAGIERL